MTTVIDASVLVAALIDTGPDGRWAVSLFSRGGLTGPEILPAETSSALRRLELSGRISAAEATMAYGDLQRLDLELFPFGPLAHRIWDLRHSVTIYDAWYVALAEALEYPLATLDKKLMGANGAGCEFLVP